MRIDSTRVSSAAIALAISLAMGGCDKQADSAQLEKAMSDFFTKEGPVEKVTCPKGIKVKANATFVCQLKFTGGDQFNVDGVIQSVEGDKFNYGFTINEPAVLPASIAATITAGLKEKIGQDVKVDCGAPRKPRANDSCTATGPDGTSAPIALTVGDSGKITGWELKGTEGQAPPPANDPAPPPADDETEPD